MPSRRARCCSPTVRATSRTPICRSANCASSPDYTLTSKAKLRKDLTLIRQRGYALAEHEHTLGLISVAVPVGVESGTPTGAISIAVPSVRFDEPFRDRALALLKVAQRRFLSGMTDEI